MAGGGSLRTLLGLIDQDDSARRLAEEGGRAFVSASLRPYVIAALADRDEAARARPALVLVGDDRAARDLAADLRAWLAPRPVRYYPSRGVAYESHLAPPPHLVGLRVAALDALLAGATADPAAGGDGDAAREAPVVVVSAAALSEKVPDPALRPHSFTLRVGELLDLDECAAELVAAGYERVDQVEERGQFAMRGGLLDVFPATEDRAVRVDMFDVEIESLRWFSTFTQRSLGDVEEVEIAPAAELAPEHRELAELAVEELTPARDGETAERPDIAELLPVERFMALLDLLEPQADGSSGGGPELIVAAEEEIAPA
jgi:transcription-repair coupling factor (superfamily II helicase)